MATKLPGLEGSAFAENHLYLEFNYRVSSKDAVAARANAVFIYSKLVAGGMAVATAKAAVEKLFDDGRTSGYEDGYDACAVQYED